ncbi:MAG: beta-galactosidase [Candidatus Micrarchaeaceae archaeon]
MKNDFYPIAVWYNGSYSRPPMMPRHPVKEELIAKDLIRIRDIGFNTLRYWVDWASCNPGPDNFDFSNVITFMDISLRYNFRVTLQIYLDSAPNWIQALYPDSLFLSQSGHAVESQSSPGYSLDHPEVKRHAIKFLHELAKAVVDHPAMFAWDVWSEPHIVNWSWFDYMGPEPWFDYNIYSQERFRDWLKKKYGNIDKLNRFWYRTYSDWKQILMPKYVTLSTFKDLLDLQEFISVKISEDLKFKVDTIKEVDTKHPVASHSAITSIMTSIMEWGGNSNDWLMAKNVDVWGTSYYPAHIGSLNPYDSSVSGLFLDATRSSCEKANVPFWVGELQAGQAIEGMKFGVPVGAAELEKWIWECVSRGATGLFFYAYYQMSCGEEISGFGLRSVSRENKTKIDGLKEQITVLKKLADKLLKSSSYTSRFAILVNHKVRALLSILRADQALLSKSIMGIYRYCHINNIPLDFIDVESTTLEELSRYDIIWAPLFLITGKKVDELIRDYVMKGGHFVTEFRYGLSDEMGENTSGIPPSEMESVFGCYETGLKECNNGLMIFRDKAKGHEFKYNGPYENLSTVTANTLYTDIHGQPIIVENSFGNGRATYVGMLLSYNFEITKDPSISAAMTQILATEYKNIRYPIIPVNEWIDIVVRKIGNDSIIFVFNNSDQTVNSITFNLRSTDKEIKFIDLRTDKVVEYYFVSNATIILSVTIGSKSVAVLETNY